MDVVRASWEAWERGDAQATLAIYDPAIETLDHDLPDAKENLPDAKESYRGFDGYIRWQADWEASWADWQWKPQEFIDAGDRVIAVLKVNATGRGSGVDVERIDPAVFTLRSGKCIRVDYYGSKADALKGRGAGGVGAIAPDPIKPASANALQIDAFRS